MANPFVFPGRLRPALLLALAALPVAAQVRVQVTAPYTTLPPGGRLQLTALVQGARDSGVRWSVVNTEGRINHEGRFLAPPRLNAATETFVIRATSVEDSKAWGELTVRVTDQAIPKVQDPLAAASGLPDSEEGNALHKLFSNLVPDYTAPRWAHRGRPFLDAATGQRYVPEAKVNEKEDVGQRPQLLRRGAGQPWRLAFPTDAEHEDGILVSYLQDDGWHRIDATGQRSLALTLTQPVLEAQVEILHKHRDGAWTGRFA